MVLIKIDGINLYYEEYGPKDSLPLIFIHGWMSSGEFWRNQVEYFKYKRRIIILDLRGHGRSDKPREEYSIQIFSEDLHSFMNQVGIKKAILVGHSMGGMINLQFTLDHQEKIERLILIETIAKSAFSLRRKLVFLISQIAFSISYNSFMRYYLTRMYRKKYPKVILEKTFEKVLKNPKYVVRSCYSSIKKFNVSQELNKITVPTYIIHGTESVIPLSQAMDMEDLIPNASLVIIEGVGHAIPREAPKKVNEILDKVIQSTNTRK
jgi:3-oxoadipate enol-lactonase